MRTVSTQWVVGSEPAVVELGESESRLLVGSWFALYPGDRPLRGQFVESLREGCAGLLPH